MINAIDSLYNALKDQVYAREFFRFQPLADLGDAIIMMRINRDLSQTKLAEMADTKQPSISGIENATGNPTYRVMQKVAEALDCVLHIELVPQEEYIEAYYRPELQPFIDACVEMEENRSTVVEYGNLPYVTDGIGGAW